MLGDEQFGVKGGSAKSWQVGTGPHIPESDADISQKPTALDALDRRATEKIAELSIVERQIVTQGHLGAWSSRKRSLARNRGETVPGARIEAVIATVDAIANERPQLKRDRAFQLDCQV